MSHAEATKGERDTSPIQLAYFKFDRAGRDNDVLEFETVHGSRRRINAENRACDKSGPMKLNNTR